MNSRLDDIPVFERRNTTLSSRLYNFARIAQKRLGTDIRLPLPKLRTLELVLEKDAWIIIDSNLNDIPVAAWTNFRREHNDVIQEPVICELRLYHKDADIILNRVLEAMELLLGEQLSELQLDKEADILPFNKK